MSAPARRRPSRLRRAAVQLLAVLVFLGLTEGGLRLAGYGPGDTAESDADPYVGFSGALPLFVPDPDESRRLVTAPYKRDHFNVQSFPATKPPGTTRIVCLGGSTTYGRPYADATSFSGWLRAWLTAAEPGRDWEVINAGGISYASYRVRRVLDELLAYEPDVVILYTGHNEFLEERTYRGLAETPDWLLALGSMARHSAVFQGLRDLVAGGAAPSTAPDSGLDSDGDGPGGTLPDEVSTLLDASIGPEAYARDDALRNQVLEHYRFNLASMLRLAREAGALTIAVTPASQLADCKPFRSEHGDGVDDATRAELERLAHLPHHGPAGWALDPDTLGALQAAVEADPRHAQGLYRLGEALLAEGRDDEALVALRRARDEDIVPLRALSPLREIVRDVARDEGARLVDAVALASQAAQELAGHPVPGSELFLDHVHMTVDGYRRLATALFDELVASGVVSPSADWPTRRAAVDDQVRASLTTEDHVRALARLAAVLDWAGKTDEAEALTDRALELGGGADAMSHWQKGNYLRERGELAAAAEAYRQAVAIDPGYAEAQFNLSVTLRLTGEPQEALRHARRAAQLSPDDPDVFFGLGLVFRDLGQTASAERAFRDCLALDGDRADVHDALGLLAIPGELEAAEQHFRDAIAAAPGAARSRYNLALLLLGTERVEEGRAALEGALEQEPGHVPSRLKLAALRAADGQPDAARALLTDGLALAPGDPRLAEALRQLPADSR